MIYCRPIVDLPFKVDASLIHCWSTTDLMSIYLHDRSMIDLTCNFWVTYWAETKGLIIMIFNCNLVTVKQLWLVLNVKFHVIIHFYPRSHIRSSTTSSTNSVYLTHCILLLKHHWFISPLIHCWCISIYCWYIISRTHIFGWDTSYN